MFDELNIKNTQASVDVKSDAPASRSFFGSLCSKFRGRKVGIVNGAVQTVVIGIQAVAVSSKQANDVTTMAIGEEGQDCGFGGRLSQQESYTDYTRGDVTTLAIGEEGQDSGYSLHPKTPEMIADKSHGGFTTLAIGEEGQDSGGQRLLS